MNIAQRYYQILGLSEPPEDLKALKKAYAKKLKVTRPEDDPNGFLQLREAFEFGKRQFSSKASVPRVSQTDKTNPAPNPIIELKDFIVEEAGPEFTSESLLRDFHEIMKSPNSREDSSPWVELFEKVNDLSIDDYIQFEDSFRLALLQAYERWSKVHRGSPPSLPRHIEKYIYKKMWGHSGLSINHHKDKEVQRLVDLMGLSLRPQPSVARQNKERPKTTTPTKPQPSKGYNWGVFVVVTIIIQMVIILPKLTPKKPTLYELQQTSEYKNYIQRETQVYFDKLDSAGVFYDPVTRIVKTESLQQFKDVEGIGFDPAYPHETLYRILGFDLEKRILWLSRFSQTGLSLNGQKRPFKLNLDFRRDVGLEKNLPDTKWLEATYETYRNSHNQLIARKDPAETRWILKGQPWDLSYEEYQDKKRQDFDWTSLDELVKIFAEYTPKGTATRRLRYDQNKEEWVLTPPPPDSSYHEIVMDSPRLSELIKTNEALKDRLNAEDKSSFIKKLERAGIKVDVASGKINLRSLTNLPGYDPIEPWKVIALLLGYSDVAAFKNILNDVGIYLM